MELYNIVTGELVDLPWPTMWHRSPKDTGEIGSPTSITETAYIPPTQQIKDMMAAGIRLADERRARFDTKDLDIQPGDEPPADPMREPNLDLVDAQRQIDELAKRTAARRKKMAVELEEKKTEPPKPPEEPSK